MKTFRAAAFHAACFLLAAHASSAGLVEVTAVGMAPGNATNAREQALTDALREAVRKGAGVDVVSQTKVSDFLLEYDRVFAASFGYVRGYTVTKAGLEDDGIYRVTVRAQVGEGRPDMSDKLALKMIVGLKQSPRVALQITESVDGLPAGGHFTKSWFEQAAREMQLNLVDTAYAGHQEAKLARRDDLTGERQTAAWRRADLAQKADFIVEAKVAGRYAGRQSLYGALPVHRFSLSADLRAIRPDTGAVLASVPMAGRDIASPLESPEQAARDAVRQLLDGDPRSRSEGAIMLFRRIITNWMTELDLGTMMRLEFAHISDAEFGAVGKTLAATPKITSVRPREFDSRGISTMDVESRLDAAGLKDLVLKALGNAFVLDRLTENYLQFVRAKPPANPPFSFDLSHLPRWAWPLIGAGALGVLALVIWLWRR
ncbi:MAG: hypothetical protein N2689_14995 [Verrucomicrobiae bacterium]|nr:hypothetical protein [Verrucomicrobiae bacterium]